MSRNDKKQELSDQMASQLSEFYSCYCLVGYTMDGERTRLQHSNTDAQFDALQQLMEDTVEKEFKVRPVVRVEEDG